MSAEMYSYESDKITADSFLTPLHLSPNTDGVRDPDYMLDWMEAFDSYNFEDYSTQDCSQFNSEPFSFNEEGDLWKQFEDPVYSQTNLDYQPLTFPDYPLLPYQQETSTQLSSTADSSITYSSQTSSPGFSPNDSPSSSAEISVLRIGNKRRSIVTSSQEESSPPVVSMKRTRGLTYKKTQTQSDQGYASLSDNSSPYDTENNSSDQKSPEVVTNVTRVIDGMIDKFSRSQVKLSEEEISALETAGLPIPTTLPLTKVEQNALRDVRRKLKNKQAAMENRRRKKEYVIDLEIKVADFEKQVSSLEERLCRVEREKQTLETELIKFRRESKQAKGSRPNNLQSGACLMVFILCFGLVCGTWFTEFGQFGGTSISQKNIQYSFPSHHTSRTLLDAGQIQQTTFEWIYNVITTSCSQLLSHLNSNFEFVSIMDLCHNDSCMQR